MPKILCIEDEEVLRRLLVDELQDAGYDTIEASNGRNGHAAILDHRPDMVLCDITMPDMNGYELLAAIRDSHSQLNDMPIIFLSALAYPEDIDLGLNMGVDDYLTKPVDYDLLLSRVAKHLKQRSTISAD